MKYFNTILTRGLNLIKSWLRPGFVLLSTLLTLFTIGASNAWAKTVYFKNTGSWSTSNVKCHYWGGSSGTSWPGATMTRIGSTAYYKQDIGNNTMCIFHNNSGTQTADQTAQDGKICYFNNNSPYWNYGSRTGFTIYFDIRNVTGWGAPYLRVGRSDHNSAYSMSLVAGTKYLYSVSSPGYDNYSAYTIANSQGWTNSHTIYQPSDEKPTGEYAITKLINYQNSNILENNVYILASSIGSTSDGADYWNVTTQTSLPSYTVSYSKTGSGTLSVTQYNGSSYVSLSSPVKPTQIIKITTTPDSGYGLSSLSVTGATKIGDTDTYYVTGNTTITATFEVLHNVTISYKCGTATIKTSTTESGVGVSTPRSVSAPDIDGYTFSSWTKGSGITITSGTTSSATISITSGASGNTLTANYAAKSCNLYKFNAAKNGTGSSVGTMTFDESTMAYYKDVTTNSSPYYFRFNFNSGTYYSTDWSTKSGTEAYTKGKTVTANGDKVACDQNVTSWGDKPSIVFNGLNSSAIRIWFDYQNKKVWITEVTYTVTINNGDHGTVSPNGSQSVGKNSGKSITATPATGYNFSSWSKTGSAVLSSTTTNPTTVTATGTGTVTANYTAKTYTVNLNKNGGSGSTAASVTATYNSSTLSASITNPTRTGYNFNGWHKGSGTGQLIIDTNGALQASTDYTNSSSQWTNDGNVTLYAGWTAKTTTVSFSQSGEGYGSGGQSTTKTATYDENMPTPISCPTAANGYAFMGYWDAAGGEGTQYYNSDGTSAHKWDKDVATETLYAYFKKAEITNIILDKPALEYVAAGGENYVKANPVIDPTPVGSRIVCWQLLYDNEDPIDGHPAVAETEGGTKPDQVKFNLAGLAAGNYRIRATLRTGSSCGGGTLLHTYDKIVTISNKFTVTVFYKCGDVTIKSSTEVEGKPITPTSITAPNITGYTFSKWKAGDGVTIEGADANGEKASATINYTAYFDGSLTAIYTRKRMIYFYNTLGWSTVNVYFYKNNSYWDDSKGTGSDHSYTYTDTPYSEQKHGTMTRISGTNIWYFDCEGAGVPSSYNTVAFTEVAQNGYGFFSYKSGTTANNVVRRDDYNSAMPMFVPVSQTPVSMNSSQAKYYSKGYWMNYPENTGYTLKIYTDPYADNATGATREILFPYSADLKMPLKLDVEFNDAARHEYWFMIYSNDNIHRGANYNMNQNYHSDVALNSNTNKIHIITSATGIYTYTLYYNNTPSYYVTVDYPVTVGDYRLVYNDLAKWSGSANHDANWWHESRVIPKKANQTDTVSFYIAKGSTPRVKVQKVNSITEGTGVISWTDVSGGWKNLESSVTKSGVYNLIMTQDGSGNLTISKITKVEPYTGNFYIRTDGAGSTKWDAYTFPDHQMTYTEFSFSSANTFGEKYSHYYMHWCERNTNIKFVVANDYSPCISDTLAQDVGDPYKNTDAGGTLKTDGATLPINDRYSSNVRFMYNYSTNKISRAYVASATNYARLFLVLKANAEIQDESREPYKAQGISNAVILMDKENWMYEEILYITPGTRFKLFACYAEATPTQSGAQYFRGAWASDAFTSDANSVILIGGSGEMQKARVIYDFKTNRLIAAWIPAGTDIDASIGINADVLIEREHQNPAQYVTFKNDGALTGVKVIYGAMKFNRWILNNRSNPNDIDPDHAKTTQNLSDYHSPLAVGQQKSIYERSLYFISFPFDVRVSEIFGFGRYWDEWYLEYYDGLNRAKNGYWIDSPPNWKYVTPEMADTMVLRKNVGYILGLDLDYMQADNFNFWSNGISTVELFFPSTTTATGSITEISEVVIPSLPSTYQCTINRTGIDGDRRVKDSYWRCIGVPSFNIYNKAVKDASGNVISWTTDYNWETNPRTFPFIYRWNMSDNTITPQSTSAFAFQPMHSYLVQNGGEIHWTNVSGPSAIVARRARKEDYTEYNWRLALMSDTTLIDQTYIRMSELEQITDSFDFGQDMSKEFNAYRSDLYTRIGYERLAANSMPLNTETTTIVPVGIKVYKAGEFTLSMPDGTYGVSITLVDNLTGARTELGAGFTYSFESEAGQFDERFHLEIAKIQSVATGTEEIGESSKSDVRKVIINGILYIVRGNRIYDARGTRVE